MMRLVLLLLVSAMVNFTAATEDSNNTESSYGSAIGSASGMSEQSISIITVSVRSSGIQTQTSSTLVMPTLSPTPGVDEEDLPLYAIIGGAGGGGLIIIIIVLLLILCYLLRRLMKAERKERPHICKQSPAVNGQHSPSCEDHTERARESPLSTSPVFHNPTYDGEVKSHPQTGASDQDGMYDTVNDEEAKRMRPDPRYSKPPELDASYAYVSHDVFRKKALSSGSPRKPLLRDPVASTKTSEPQGYSEPIERTDESEYSHLQHYTAVTSTSKRYSAPLLSSTECIDHHNRPNSRVRYSNLNLLSSSALEDPPQPTHQQPSNPPAVPQHPTTLDHIYHVLDNTQPVSPSTAVGSPLPVLPYQSSEPEHGSSTTYPQSQFQELYDTINEVPAPQAIYDTPVDIPQEIYDEVK